MTIALLLNFVVAESYVMPNSHEYNTGNPNMIVELLYSLESGNGYQPFPNVLTITLTLVAGLIGGIVAYSRVVRSKS